MMNITKAPRGWVWMDYYQPQSVSDILLSKRNRYLLNRWMDGDIRGYFFFWGDTGTGKSTAARAYCNDMKIYVAPEFDCNGAEWRLHDKVDKLTAHLRVPYNFTKKDMGNGVMSDSIGIIFEEISQFGEKVQEALKASYDEVGRRNKEALLTNRLLNRLSIFMTCNDASSIDQAIRGRSQSLYFVLDDDVREQAYAWLRAIADANDVPISNSELTKLMNDRENAKSIRQMLNALQNFIPEL